MQEINKNEFNGFEPEDSELGWAAVVAVLIAFTCGLSMILLAGIKGVIDYFLF
jgi:hypothetical protein